MNVITRGAGLIAVAALLTPAAIHAQGPHPHYLSARTDLRTAQLLSRIEERPTVALNLKAADHEMAAAIKEIDDAAVIDRKDLIDQPPIDAKIARLDRFRKIVDLLRTARTDLEQEEKNARAGQWRDAAIQHIDEALKSVRKAAVDAQLDRQLGDF
jgi:hypothetical protein